MPQFHRFILPLVKCNIDAEVINIGPDAEVINIRSRTGFPAIKPDRTGNPDLLLSRIDPGVKPDPTVPHMWS